MDIGKKGLSSKIKYLGIFVLFIGACIYLFYSSPIFSQILNLDLIMSNIATILPKLVILIIMFLIFKLTSVFVVDYFVGKFMEAFHTRARIVSIKSMINFFLWVVYVMIALLVLTGDFNSFVASLGLVGLGLTFALQKPIMNFVGWITISVKDIYNQNDRIRIGTVVGDVKEVQMMNTVLYGLLEDSDTRSHKIITIPNELVLTQEVENFTKDSNYIMTKLKISVTYESNVKKAMEILNGIIKGYMQENIKDYRKWEKRKGSLKKVFDSFLSKNPQKKNKEINSEKEKELKDLQEEFMPSIRINLADSSVDLTALFLVPYEKGRFSKTQISRDFLERSRKEKDIEIAYPHLEVIYKKEKKK